MFEIRHDTPEQQIRDGVEKCAMCFRKLLLFVYQGINASCNRKQYSTEAITVLLKIFSVWASFLRGVISFFSPALVESESGSIYREQTWGMNFIKVLCDPYTSVLLSMSATTEHNQSDLNNHSIFLDILFVTKE